MFSRKLFVLCASMFVSDAAELAFGPYLQDVRADRALVMWVTRGDAGNGKVTVPTGQAEATFASTVVPLVKEQTNLGEDLWLHSAALTGLDSGTAYSYSVFVDGQPLVSNAPKRFRTAGNGPFEFLVVGDTGDNGAGQHAMAQRLNRESAAFLLHTGDIAYWTGTFEQYRDAYFKVYEPLLSHVPVFPTLGNHDAPNGAEAYRTFFRPPLRDVPTDSRGLYYSFDWGDVHFTVLDSNDSLLRALDGGGKMIEWLERDLAATRATWRIVSLHHPPFPATVYKRDDPLCQLARLNLTQIFERHGVHVVFAGHEHVYHRTRPRRAGEFLPLPAGTVYVTTGGGGSQLYDAEQQPFTAATAAGAHFLRASVSSTELRIEAVRLDGELVDSWRLSPGPVFVDSPVRDAASFGNTLAAGGLVSIVGWNFGGDGAVLQVEGRPAPLLFSSRTQLNAQLPFETPASSLVRVTTRHGTADVAIKLQQSAPAVFSVMSGNRHTAAALHASGSLVTELDPARGGEWIGVFATGLGRAHGGWPTGIPAPIDRIVEIEQPVVVQIGGRDAEAALACLAPGFIGLYQINFRLPVGLGGGELPLVVRVGGHSSVAVPLPVAP